MINIWKNKRGKQYTVAISVILTCLMACPSGNKKDTAVIRDVINTFEGEPVIPREANKIFITEFIDFKKMPSLVEKLAIKIRKQITLDARLAVVSDKTMADLMLSGIVLDYQVQNLKYDSFNKPVRKRLRIVSSAKLFDLVKNKEIFYEREIQAFEEYSEIIPPITSEMQIQDKVLDDMSKRIALLIVNGWYTKLMTPVEKGKSQK